MTSQVDEVPRLSLPRKCEREERSGVCRGGGTRPRGSLVVYSITRPGGRIVSQKFGKCLWTRVVEGVGRGAAVWVTGPRDERGHRTRRTSSIRLQMVVVGTAPLHTRASRPARSKRRQSQTRTGSSPITMRYGTTIAAAHSRPAKLGAGLKERNSTDGL